MALGYVARAGQEQRIEFSAGSVYRITLDAAATEGRLTVFRSTMRDGAASPVHIHERDDETALLLSGSGIVWVGDQRWEVKSGDTVFLPRGVPHTFLSTSDETELLTVCNPAGIEEVFRTAGWDLADPKPEDWAVDPKVLAKAREAAGQIVLGPALGRNDPMPAAYLHPS